MNPDVKHAFSQSRLLVAVSITWIKLKKFWVSQIAVPSPGMKIFLVVFKFMDAMVPPCPSYTAAYFSIWPSAASGFASTVILTLYAYKSPTICHLLWYRSSFCSREVPKRRVIDTGNFSRNTLNWHQLQIIMTSVTWSECNTKHCTTI